MKQNLISLRRMVRAFGLTALASVFLAAVPVLPASAQQPEPWQLGFQAAHSPIAEQMHEFHNILLWIIFAISLFVLGLLLYTVVRYRESANPTPSRTTHNTLIEILWTAIPIVILVVIGIFSLPLLYATDDTTDADMTIKAIGRQWYWSYEYPDHGNFAFDAFMVAEENLQAGQPRLLTTDENVVVPVGAKVRVLVTSSDVLHAFALPAAGNKIDAVPGRINETWFQLNSPGMYYGQCSELCGAGHAFMPIAIKAVPQAEFDAWVAEAQQRFAKADGSAPEARPIQVVRNEMGETPATAQ